MARELGGGLSQRRVGAGNVAQGVEEGEVVDRAVVGTHVTSTPASSSLRA